MRHFLSVDVKNVHFSGHQTFNQFAPKLELTNQVFESFVCPDLHATQYRSALLKSLRKNGNSPKKDGGNEA